MGMAYEIVEIYKHSHAPLYGYALRSDAGGENKWMKLNLCNLNSLEHEIPYDPNSIDQIFEGK